MNRLFPTALERIQWFSASSLLSKVHQKLNKTTIPDPNDIFLVSAYKEMSELRSKLTEEFNRHFSLKTDLSVFEDCNVVLPDGETHKMNRLGRILMKNPEQIVINFEDNPSVIKAAKAALLKSAICSNPQQEGVMIYIPVQRTSRELRQQITDNAKKILNDYKDVLNKTFRKHSSKNELNKNANERQKRKETLLQYKKDFEKDGEMAMKERQTALMKEVT